MQQGDGQAGLNQAISAMDMTPKGQLTERNICPDRHTVQQHIAEGICHASRYSCGVGNLPTTLRNRGSSARRRARGS